MGFLRRYVFHDIGLKLFSLLMAVCLWAVVTQDHVEELLWKANIELHSMPQQLEISSVSLPEAKIWLSGPSRVVNHLGSDSVHVVLDLSRARPGERTYSLDSRNVHVPDGVRVKQIDPAQVQIHLDVRKTRIVEVHPRVVGRLASGFAITRVLATPPQITVVGPAKRVDMVDEAVTDPVDATGLLSQRSFTTNAYVSDPLVQVVNPAPVRVTVFVGKSLPSRN
ncbi:MAG: YbbR-like domain-containing protein [Chlamydiota bacterium]